MVLPVCCPLDFSPSETLNPKALNPKAPNPKALNSKTLKPFLRMLDLRSCGLDCQSRETKLVGVSREQPHKVPYK